MDDESNTRKSYPTDVTDDEWAFCAPYLTLMKEEAPQREYPLREIFNALRYMVRAGCPWRMLPNDLVPWTAVYGQTQRWFKAGVFEAMAHDLRMLLRLAQSREVGPSVAIIDGRTIQSTPESGSRAGDDGYKRKKGSKIHAAVDTLGHLLALKVTPANEQERHQVGEIIDELQSTTGQHVQVMYADQGYTGEAAATAAQERGVELVVVKLAEAKPGFVLLPKRWVVERSFAWAARFRRLAKDYERLSSSVVGLHWVAFITLMLNSIFHKSA
jgi:transposase